MKDEKHEKLIKAANAALNALVKLVRETLPDYPEENMMILKDMSVEDARQIIKENELK